VTATIDTLLALDDELVRAGHHPLTPWWRDQLRRFYEHPTARTLVARVGRGGTKSTTAVKVSLNETLFGDWPVPDGEEHWWVHASVNKDEPTARLLLAETYLRALGERYERTGDKIRLVTLRRGLKIVAAQIQGVSGDRAYGLSIDEVAKQRYDDSKANPIHEVVASATAMTVTHPGARRLLLSSPLGMTDYHFKRYALGDTDEQLVCEAPTWVANPCVTEEQTHKLEPDERIWSREYAAIPQAGALAVFEPEAIRRAFVWPVHMGSARRVGVIDPSSGKADRWSYGICGWREVEGMKKLVFDSVGDEGEGQFWRQKSGDAVVAAVAQAFRAADVHSVHSDQRESLMLRAAFRREGIKFHEHPWTSSSKEIAVSFVRQMLRDGLLVLPEHERLRDELLEFEERTSTTGGFTFGARGSGHDDFVALLLTAAMAEKARLLRGSPNKSIVSWVDAFQSESIVDRLRAEQRSRDGF
jgi:hypothetical protein